MRGRDRRGPGLNRPPAGAVPGLDQLERMLTEVTWEAAREREASWFVSIVESAISGLSRLKPEDR